MVEDFLLKVQTTLLQSSIFIYDDAMSILLTHIYTCNTPNYSCKVWFPYEKWYKFQFGQFALTIFHIFNKFSIMNGQETIEKILWKTKR